jgi:nucleoid DNA-binding protein
MARQSGVTQGEAADRLDRVVREILERLREGQSVPFPGLGHFQPGAGGKVGFQRDRGHRDV